MRTSGRIDHLAADARVVAFATGSRVVALNARTGRQLWLHEHPDGAAPTSLLVGGDHVVATWESVQELTVHDRAGAVWHLPLREGRQAWMTLDQDTLSVAEPGRLTAYTLSEHRVAERWTRIVGASGDGWAPLVASGHVITTEAGDQQDGAAMRLVSRWTETGDEQWSVPLTATVPPVVVDDATVVASDGEQVHGLSLVSGEPRWTRHIAEVEVVVPTASGQVAVVAGTGVHLLDARSGDEVTSVEIGHRLGDVVTDGHGGLVAAASGGMQHLDAAFARIGWALGLQADRTDRTAGALAVVPGAFEPLAVATLADGHLLAALPLASEADPEEACPSRSSDEVGGLAAWRGDHVHVAIVGHDDGVDAYELWIAIPGADTATTVRVIATDDGGHRAPLGTDDGDPRAHALLTGGRSSPGFPPHWVTPAELWPACWDVEVEVGDRTEMVRVPLPAR